jgi:carbonic anhydrase
MSPTKGIGKILAGVLKYNQKVKGELVPIFREILDKPAPKSILVSCIDSRIVASRLLQAEPGAYFHVR